MIDLTPERGLIFRIMHVENVPWTLANGLHCRSSNRKQSDYKEIGNPDLIAKRATRLVPIPPGGSLSDYIPFYFTPYSPMLLNIKTGYGGIKQVPLDEIIILVASLRKLADDGLPFVFSDRHAYLETAEFFSDLGRLDRIDWTILRNRDFKRDPNDLGKMERYQAEALIHQHLPCDSLSGIVCRNPETVARVQGICAEVGCDVNVVLRPGYYL